MKRKRVSLKSLDNDSIIEHWITLHSNRKEYQRLNDLEGVEIADVNIKLTHQEMRERGLFNVNVNRKERS
jgi:hypothetical protein